jgi:hypothetical protein
MNKALEEERDKRRLDNIQETIRCILADYFKERKNSREYCQIFINPHWYRNYKKSYKKSKIAL